MTDKTIQRVRGVKSVELCLLVNGKIPATPEWDIFAETVPDSVVVTKGAPTTVEEYIEEQDDATDSFDTQKAIREMAFSTRNFNGVLLQKYLGGTYTAPTAQADGEWVEPSVSPNIEVAVRITSANAVKVAIKRGKIRIDENLALKKSGSAQLDFKVKQLSSGSAEESGYSISFPRLASQPE